MSSNFRTEQPLHESTGTYLNFVRAKKALEVKKEAEKFRIGNKIRNMERKVMLLQIIITTISLVCIMLAVLVQEITFYGSYSNSLGGEWFLQPEQPPIKSSDLEISADTNLVVVMKFVLSKLTTIQLITMCFQFKIYILIMLEQKHLDASILDDAEQREELEEGQMLTLARTLGYSSFYTILMRFFAELAICAIHPPPFVKKRFVTTIIGREAIYNFESLVCVAPFPFYHDDWFTFKI